MIHPALSHDLARQRIAELQAQSAERRRAVDARPTIAQTRRRPARLRRLLQRAQAATRA